MIKKMLTFLPVLLLVCTVSACKTTRPAQENEVAMNKPDPVQDNKRRIETAKINAQLGMAYLEQKNVKRAKQKLLMALDGAPDIPEPWYSMGYFQEATGNKLAAREYYLKAIKVAPERGDAHNNYGTFLCRSGKYVESIKQFVMAAKAPQYLDASAAYENAGLCAMNSGDYRHAAGFFQQAINEDPSRTLSLIKLAESEYKQGNYKQAKAAMQTYSMLAAPTEESKRVFAELNKKIG